MSTISKSKTRKHKYDLWQLISLTCASTSSLTHAPQLSECIYIEMRRTSLLFIFFRSLYFHSNKSASLDNYLLRLTSLGESNNPISPQLWGLYPPEQQGGLTSTQLWGLLPWLKQRVNLNEFTWLFYIIDSLDRNIGVWHDSLTL